MPHPSGLRNRWRNPPEGVVGKPRLVVRRVRDVHQIVGDLGQFALAVVLEAAVARTCPLGPRYFAPADDTHPRKEAIPAWPTPG